MTAPLISDKYIGFLEKVDGVPKKSSGVYTVEQLFLSMQNVKYINARISDYTPIDSRKPRGEKMSALDMMIHFTLDNNLGERQAATRDITTVIDWANRKFLREYGYVPESVFYPANPKQKNSYPKYQIFDRALPKFATPQDYLTLNAYSDQLYVKDPVNQERYGGIIPYWQAAGNNQKKQVIVDDGFRDHRELASLNRGYDMKEITRVNTFQKDNYKYYYDKLLERRV